VAKQNLTESYVRKLDPPTKGRLAVHDAKVRGLVLMVTPPGTKTFVFYKRVSGKPTRVLLGHWPSMTVELARDRAVEVYADIVRGADPNEVKRVQRREGATLQDVFVHYLENKIKARGAPSTAVAHECRFRTCLGTLADRRLDSIRRDEVIALHVALGKDKGQTSANRAIQLLRVQFNYAADKLGLDVVNVAARIELFPERTRERFLKGDELPRFFAALAQEDDELLRDFFVVALYTGARRGNVQSMKWDDVDLGTGTWTISAGEFKARRPMHVVLSAEVLVILDRRKKYARTEFVFPSHGKRGHLVEPKSAWERLRKRSGLTDLRIHDLRRTLGSWQAAGGSSLPIIGKSLGHTQAATTQIYARLDLDDVRASVAAATAAIKVAGEKKPEKESEK